MFVVGCVWLSWAVTERTPPPPDEEVRGELIVYGESPSAFGQLWVPRAGNDAPAPVVVVIHGGFWQRRVADLSIMSPMVEALFAEGFAVWNIEYGRVGETEGGWPHTFDHVAAAVDHVAHLGSTHGVDASRVAVVGHSAGGHLAVWSGGRGDLFSGDPGAVPVIDPGLIVALAPVSNLERADEEGLGNDAVAKFLGGHVEVVPDRYRVAGVGRSSPALHVVVGTEDRLVPERFAIPDEETTVTRLIGLDHFDLIDPQSPVMSVVVDALDAWRRDIRPRAE